MAYHMDWLVEGRLIFMTLQGHISTADALAIDAQVLTMLTSAVHPVYTLGDLSRVTSLPAVGMVMHRLQSPTHPLYYLAVTYGSNSFALTLVLALVGLFKLKYRNFRNRDEAVAFLQQLEPDLFKPIQIPSE